MPESRNRSVEQDSVKNCSHSHLLVLAKGLKALKRLHVLIAAWTNEKFGLLKDEKIDCFWMKGDMNGEKKVAFS